MKSLLLSLAALSTLSSTAIAADIEAGVVKRMIETPATPLIKQDPIDINSLTLDTGNQGLMTLAAATGISYFEIGNIGSSNVGWETIQSYQTTTLNDHGGSQLYAYVWQVGYGNIGSASINGISKTAEQSQYRCGSDLHICATGETVTGWVYLYNLSGQQSGTFTVSANSIASPYGYWSDSIYIQ